MLRPATDVGDVIISVGVSFPWLSLLVLKQAVSVVLN